MPDLVTHWDPSLLNHKKHINSELHALPGHTREGINCFKHILRLILINTESVAMQGNRPLKATKINSVLKA